MEYKVEIVKKAFKKVVADQDVLRTYLKIIEDRDLIAKTLYDCKDEEFKEYANLMFPNIAFNHVLELRTSINSQIQGPHTPPPTAIGFQFATPTIEPLDFSLGNISRLDKLAQPAAKIAEAIIQTEMFKAQVNLIHRDHTRLIATNMRNVTIEFCQVTDAIRKEIFGNNVLKQNDEVLAWTDRETEARKIMVNDVICQILQRAEKEPKQENQKAMLTFFLAGLIIHELGHLFFRWAGKEKSPPICQVQEYPEAGEHLENRLFNGVFKLMIDTSDAGNRLSLNSKIRGVSISSGAIWHHRIDVVYMKQMISDARPDTILPIKYREPGFNMNTTTALRAQDEECMQEEFEDDNLVPLNLICGTVKRSSLV